MNVSSLQKQISAENPFTSDFIRFLEQFPADWFPSRRLQNISFPIDENDPNGRFLNKRLNQLKVELSQGNVAEYSGRYNRLAIRVDYGWINEINIDPVRWSDESFIAVRMHFGDTKGQGQRFFRRKPRGVEWDEEIAGHRIIIIPYLKISDAYGSALFWICPTLEESKVTHTRDFFDDFAGKWDLREWPEFENRLSVYVGDWKTRCFIADGTQPVSWEQNLTETGRTRFLLSVGTYLQVLVPYAICQELDDSLENPRVLGMFGEIINAAKEKIEAD